MKDICDTVNRKFIESFDVSDWEIETDTGWEDIAAIHKTIEYDEWILKTNSGKEITCADDHIVFDDSFNQIFVKDCIPNQTKIITKDGIETVTSVIKTDESSNMYDVTVNSPNHRYYTNDILSHNTTAITAIILHYVIFNHHKNVAILANKAEVSREILARIKLAYEHLPQWLQQGVVEWNKGSIILENGSRIMATATSSNNIRGFAVNMLFIDEAAFIENWDEFFTSVYPTISSGETTKLILVSTVNGLNHFHKVTQLARQKKNRFKLISVTWKDVPGRDEKWRERTLADMNYDYEKFAQEYENEYLGSSGTLITGSKLKQLVEGIELPSHDVLGLKVYEQYKKGDEYVMVCDVSRGKGIDYSAFQLINISKMPYRQAAVFRNNMITPIEFTEIINRFGRMYGDCAVMIEVNDIGAQVADLLFFDYEYENMLFTATQGSRGKTVTTSLRKTTDKGVRTTLPVKNIGCSILKLLIEQDQLLLYDENTIHELATFSQKGKSYEAEVGKHDDLVMCLVLFAWLTEQQYFKMLTDLNTLMGIREREQKELEDELLPIGFVDRGIAENRSLDLELNLHKDENWQIAD